LRIRTLLEESDREILTVGGVFHKWTWGSAWKQTEYPRFVFGDPVTRQPVFVPDSSGASNPLPADPKMPEEFWPTSQDGRKLKILKVPGIKTELVKEGPVLSIRPYESIEFPESAKAVDPNDWDWLADNFTVSPWWFLGREGDPFDGRLQNLDKLWKFLRVDPNNIYMRPDKRLVEPIKLKEWHGKFPMTSSGRPIEIFALVATDARLLLAWRPSPFVRRPYFNRQVWSRGDYPLGKGIPETTWPLRNAADALFNQEIDYNNIYGHPPMLLSSLAMMDDEDYENVGPGTQFVMQDINGAKFLSVPPTTRNTLELENWVISMMQRLWGVTDLTTNAPTSSLSPNVTTATGTTAILNQGSLKFGHLTKKLSETDSDEHQFRHEMFRTMMANARIISVKGKPVTIHPQDKEEFFSSNIRVRARGDGITTNPVLRVQILLQAKQIFAQDPFVAGDLEVLKDLDEQILAALGLKLNLKDPQVLQELKLIQQVIQIPGGRDLIGQAVQQVQQMMAQAQVGQGKGSNGVPQLQ